MGFLPRYHWWDLTDWNYSTIWYFNLRYWETFVNLKIDDIILLIYSILLPLSFKLTSSKTVLVILSGACFWYYELSPSIMILCNDNIGGYSLTLDVTEIICKSWVLSTVYYDILLKTEHFIITCITCFWNLHILFWLIQLWNYQVLSPSFQLSISATCLWSSLFLK